METPANTSISFAGNSVNICAISMFPSMSDISMALSMAFSGISLPQLPNFNIDLTKFKLGIPTLPNPLLPAFGIFLPSPLFGNIHIPSMESLYASLTMMSTVVQKVVTSMINKIAGVLGMSIDDILSMVSDEFSRIYNIALNIADIIDVNITNIILAIKNAFKFNINFTMPGMPSPLFPNLTMPLVQWYHIAQDLIANFWTCAMTVVTGLISRITNLLNSLKLPIPTIPSIPAMPTMPDIIAMLLNLAHVPDIMALIKKYGTKLEDLFNSLSAIILSGFPFNLVCPDLHLPLNFTCPSINLKLKISMFIQDISQLVVKFITGIIQQLLNVLNITIPLPFPICIPIPIPVTPILPT